MTRTRQKCEIATEARGMNSEPLQSAIYSSPPRPLSHSDTPMAKSGKKTSPGRIAQNRRARHDYFIEDKFEAGLMLMGWEVKSIRDGKVQLAEAFVQIHQGEAYLAGCNITPLLSASTHVIAEPQRMRKLLLHAKELSRLFIASQQKGYTIVPLALYWKGNKVKCEIALGKGKKQHDKRDATREKDWARDKQRLFKVTRQ